MQLVTSLASLPAAARGAVVALGNFDGVHKGHQVVLAAAREKARALQRPFGVVTFEPHPRDILFPSPAPYRITPAPAKRRLLAQMGTDVLFEIPFTAEFSGHTAEYFIEDVLLEALGIGGAVAGHDFVFGHRRGGTMALLAHRLAQKNVPVTEIAAQNDAGGQLWSSTRIRACIQKGDMQGAAAMLGRAWDIEGVVAKGDGRGAGLGFPTANIALADVLRPAYGVYAVRLHTGGWVHDGVANIGVRPTVDGVRDGLEVHLFGYSGSLYGAAVRVEMLEFIRPEKRFDGLEALSAQIALDCRAARDILARL